MEYQEGFGIKWKLWNFMEMQKERTHYFIQNKKIRLDTTVYKSILVLFTRFVCRNR